MPDAAIRDDIALLMAKRHANGADFWAGPGGKIYVGNPFSTLACLGMLHELGVTDEDEVVSGALGLVREACRPDGRIRLGPKTPMYPCYTAEAARILCRFGLAESEEVQRTIAYFFEAAHADGGWRCNFSRLGKGPSTAWSNPGATLYVLDVLRHQARHRSGHEASDRAIMTLLDHWVDRAPRGPCQWGIGTLFQQVEFPFLRYNLFFFVYVLSFYSAALADERFHQALALLHSKVDGEGRLVVERPHRQLSKLAFCRKGMGSDLASRRFAEVMVNVEGTG